MKITKADIGAAPGIAALERQCFSMPRSEAAIADELQGEHSAYFIAETCGEIIGYAGVTLVLDEISICNVAVKSSFRSQKIGERILNRVLAYGRENGFLSVFLEVRSSNAAAIGFYEKLNFVKTGVRKNFYQKPVEDALIYRLEIK